MEIRHSYALEYKSETGSKIVKKAKTGEQSSSKDNRTIKQPGSETIKQSNTRARKQSGNQAVRTIKQSNSMDKRSIKQGSNKEIITKKSGAK